MDYRPQRRSKALCKNAGTHWGNHGLQEYATAAALLQCDHLSSCLAPPAHKSAGDSGSRSQVCLQGIRIEVVPKIPQIPAIPVLRPLIGSVQDSQPQDKEPAGPHNSEVSARARPSARRPAIPLLRLEPAMGSKRFRLKLQLQLIVRNREI